MEGQDAYLDPHRMFNMQEQAGPLPPTHENGEDMQISFQASISNGIKTFCPPHDPDDQSMWSSLKAWEYGNDSKASSNGSLKSIPQFYKERDDIINHYLEKGYKPVLTR